VPRQGKNVSQNLQLRPEESLLAQHEALFRVSRAINVYRDPKELFRGLAKELRQLVDFDFMALFLYDETANKVQSVVLEPLEGPGFAIPADVPAEETITWWVYQHQEAVLIVSRDEELRFPRMMELHKGYGVESACILPLTTAYRRLGSLSFGARYPGAYSSNEMRYLSLVAEQVALAVDKALRNEEQRRGGTVSRGRPETESYRQLAMESGKRRAPEVARALPNSRCRPGSRKAISCLVLEPGSSRRPRVPGKGRQPSCSREG